MLQVCTATDLTDTMGELTCPDNCTNPSQGICNGYDGTCTCMPGFGGDNCSGNYSFLIILTLLFKISGHFLIIKLIFFCFKLITAPLMILIMHLLEIHVTILILSHELNLKQK